MKKLYIFVLIAAVLALLKIGFDVYGLNAQQTQLIEKLEKLEKTNSNLNDQLAALQRKGAQDTSSVASNSQTQSEVDQSIQPRDMIQQQLHLVDFALKQHQFHYAVEKLQELDRQIDGYVIAPAIKDSLHQSIENDIALIKKYALNHEAQQQKMNQLLSQLNTELKAEITSPQISMAQDENTYFWEKWIKVEKVSQSSEQFMHRTVILKEAQLRILIARSALIQGEYVQFHQEMKDIVELLNIFPDQKSQIFVLQIKNIDAMTLISAPTLTTRTLLG